MRATGMPAETSSPLTPARCESGLDQPVPIGPRFTMCRTTAPAKIHCASTPRRSGNKEEGTGGAGKKPHLQRGQVKPPAWSLASCPTKACPAAPSAFRCGKPMRTCRQVARQWVNSNGYAMLVCSHRDSPSVISHSTVLVRATCRFRRPRTMRCAGCRRQRRGRCE